MLSSERTITTPSRGPSPAPGSSPIFLSQLHIAEAIKSSPDNGATLDLTHKNLSLIGETGAQELATIVRDGPNSKDVSVSRMHANRIALGFNRLTDLPEAFGLLTCLRYLTLKNNKFSVFPHILTCMPSLEILDLSRNKISEFPAECGSLSNLKVLSLSRNRLTNLPSYLARFDYLEILKVDHNPLDWSDGSLSQCNGNLDDPKVMRSWIRDLKERLSNTTRHVEERNDEEDEFSIELDAFERSLISGSESWSRLLKNGAGHGSHSRSPSFDSEYSSPSNLGPSASSSQISSSPLQSPTLTQPPPLLLGVPHQRDRSRSPSRSPVDSAVSSNDDAIPATAQEEQLKHQQALHDLQVQQQQQQIHARNASYAGGTRKTPRSGLSGKKSLPDLRTANLTFDSSRDTPTVPRRSPKSEAMSQSRRGTDLSNLSARSNSRKDSASSEGKSSVRNAKSLREPAMTGPAFTVSKPSMDLEHERHGYFKRHSIIQQSVQISNVPPSLFYLVDGARSLLFAVSQIHQSLNHYVSFSSDELFCNLIQKILDIAGVQLSTMISALDRFDASSTQFMPNPQICRNVIEASRDTALAYGKAVKALSMHLSPSANDDNPHYMRQMLLVLYGATAEISSAWHIMRAHVDLARPLLIDQRKNRGLKSAVGSHNIPNGFNVNHTDLSSPSSNFHNLTSSNLPPTPRSMLSQPAARVRMTRRQAGSFSSKDVEVGKNLPSYDVQPVTLTLRPGLRSQPATPSSATAPALPGLPSSSSVLLSAMRSSPRNAHSRQGSQASLANPIASISTVPSLPQSNSVNWETGTLSKAPTNKEALEAMKITVDTAPVVWHIMDEMMKDGSEFVETRVITAENLAKAKLLTDRLRSHIHGAQKNYTSSDRKVLRDDAHHFVKIVVQLSSTIRSYAGSHARFPELRTRIAALAQSTEDFIILLHASSFSPTSTPRTFSPMPGAGLNHNPLLAASRSEVTRLGPSLSRSKSTHIPGPSQVLQPKDGPRSAYPGQSFNIPSPNKLFLGREHELQDVL